jgi:RNA polymerase subunit RPABC4/transcription elongation factor Spt4
MPKQSASGGLSACNSCGSSVKSNAKFCPKCGNKIQ